MQCYISERSKTAEGTKLKLVENDQTWTSNDLQDLIVTQNKLLTLYEELYDGPKHPVVEVKNISVYDYFDSK